MTNVSNEQVEEIAEDTDEWVNITTAGETSQTAQAKLLLLKDCTEHDVRILKEAAAKIVNQNVVPVSNLIKSPWISKWSRITYGCSALDRCTLGGVITRGITEICGAAGAGKTQILLQLALSVQLPEELGGLNKGAAYISTECAFSSKRIFQISESFLKKYPEHNNINYLSNVYVEHVLDSDDLLKCVSQRLSKLMASSNIGLIIIDSVAAVYRVNSNFIKRARDMRKLANYLLQYADKYKAAVVCVNQVTSVPKKNCDMPCLGLAWAHLGRTRIKISKVPKQVNINNQLVTVRKLEIMYSPETPNEFAEFLITENGVVDVP